jgi:hypothetical protein
MDLLKFSKKITPYGMIGLILTNSITPAFAHGNHEADINSFQNSQSVVVTQQVESNQEIESNQQNTDSLNIFQDHITGKFVSSQHVLEHGGTYNNPLNPEEVIFLMWIIKIKYQEKYLKIVMIILQPYLILKVFENYLF